MKQKLLLTVLSVITLVAARSDATDGSLATSHPSHILISQNQRIDALEAELASLRTLVGDDGPAKHDYQYGSCSSRTIYAGVELLLLRPQMGSLTIKEPFGITLNPTQDYYASGRFYAGIESASGIGARIRYWQLDNGASAQATSADVEVEAIDFEATVAAYAGCTELLFFGGARYGNIDTRLGLGLEDIPLIGELADFRHGSEGVGPTVGMSVRREFGCRGLALVGGLRGAWLYGQTHAGIEGDVLLEADQTMTQVWEAQLGVEYTRNMGAYNLVVRAAWEAQSWEIAPIGTLLSQDIGFQGLVLSLGASY